MAGCPGCLLSGKELQAQYDKTREAAQQYANDNKIAVAIYRDIDGYSFISLALSAGYPIKEIIQYSV